MTLKYNAFISYSHADSGNIAPAIQRGIQVIGQPWYRFKRRLNIFRDESNLAASPQLWMKIEEALRETHYFILFASPKAAVSYWVRKEIAVWLQQNYSEENGVQKIIIVLTNGELNWAEAKTDFEWEKTNTLPKDLFSGKFKSMPLWVDLRPYVKGNDLGKQIDIKAAGFTTAMTKIIGEILNLPPWQVESDELRRERTIKRFLTITSFVLILLVGISSVLFFREKAARKEEEAAKKLAETRRKEAEKNLRDFKIEKFQRDIRNGSVYLDAQEYCFAKASYKEAEAVFKDPLYQDDALVIEYEKTFQTAMEICKRKCPQ